MRWKGVDALREPARERREVAELGVRQAVAARTRRPGARRDAPPAVAAGLDPGVRAQRDAARLEQAKRRDDPLEGRDRADADVALVVLGADRVDAGDDQERGLPGGAAHAVQAARLGGHVDGVGADDRRAGELELFDLHLEAAQRHRDLDLAERDLAAVEELLDRLASAGRRRG